MSVCIYLSLCVSTFDPVCVPKYIIIQPRKKDSSKTIKSPQIAMIFMPTVSVCKLLIPTEYINNSVHVYPDKTVWLHLQRIGQFVLSLITMMCKNIFSSLYRMNCKKPHSFGSATTITPGLATSIKHDKHTKHHAPSSHPLAVKLAVRIIIAFLICKVS